MKESTKLKKKYDQLRSQLIAEISLSLKLHKDIEIEPEFKKPIIFAPGHDIDDEHQLIEEVSFSGVNVFHRGDQVQTVPFAHLHTDTLISLLDGMEKSLESAKKFIGGK